MLLEMQNTIHLPYYTKKEQISAVTYLAITDPKTTNYGFLYYPLLSCKISDSSSLLIDPFGKKLPFPLLNFNFNIALDHINQSKNNYDSFMKQTLFLKKLFQQNLNVKQIELNYLISNTQIHNEIINSVSHTQKQVFDNTPEIITLPKNNLLKHKKKFLNVYHTLIINIVALDELLNLLKNISKFILNAIEKEKLISLENHNNNLSLSLTEINKNISKLTKDTDKSIKNLTKNTINDKNYLNNKLKTLEKKYLKYEQKQNISSLKLKNRNSLSHNNNFKIIQNEIKTIQNEIKTIKKEIKKLDNELIKEKKSKQNIINNSLKKRDNYIKNETQIQNNLEWDYNVKKENLKNINLELTKEIQKWYYHQLNIHNSLKEYLFSIPINVDTKFLIPIFTIKKENTHDGTIFIPPIKIVPSKSKRFWIFGKPSLKNAIMPLYKELDNIIKLNLQSTQKQIKHTPSPQSISTNFLQQDIKTGLQDLVKLNLINNVNNLNFLKFLEKKEE